MERLLGNYGPHSVDTQGKVLSSESETLEEIVGSAAGPAGTTKDVDPVQTDTAQTARRVAAQRASAAIERLRGRLAKGGGSTASYLRRAARVLRPEGQNALEKGLWHPSYIPFLTLAQLLRIVRHDCHDAPHATDEANDELVHRPHRVVRKVQRRGKVRPVRGHRS